MSSFDNYTNLKNAASAIMTTDKYPKYISKSYHIGKKKITFRGICKGAGMIEPNMATMLSFIETNVSLSKSSLKSILNIAHLCLSTVFLLMVICLQMILLYFHHMATFS